MGIYDREYYRGETQGSGWLTGAAPACKAIIVLNVAAFILQRIDPSLETSLKASSDAILRSGHIWQLITATFLHGDILHLFWNMLFLWMVGREMEAMYNTRNFVALYLTAAVISTLGWALADKYYFEQHDYMVGASGAIMAVIVVYAMYYPRREILLFFVVPVEMRFIVAVYLAVNLVQFFNHDPNLSVAVASHLTGAAYGFLYKYFDLRLSRLTGDRLKRPRLRIVTPEPREKVAPRPAPSPTWSSAPPNTAKPAATVVLPQELLDARLDEILAKIAREGRESLTEEENRLLQEASRRARSRRSDRL